MYDTRRPTAWEWTLHFVQCYRDLMRRLGFCVPAITSFCVLLGCSEEPGSPETSDASRADSDAGIGDTELSESDVGEPDHSSELAAEPLDVPSTYTFDSRYLTDTDGVEYGEATVRLVLIEDLPLLIRAVEGAFKNGLLDLLPSPFDGAAVGGPEADLASCEEALVLGMARYLRNGEDVTGDGAPDSIDDLVIAQAFESGAPPFDPARRTYGAIAPGVSLVAVLAGVDETLDSVDWRGGNMLAYGRPVDGSDGAYSGPPIDYVEAMAAETARLMCEAIHGSGVPQVNGEEVPLYIDPVGWTYREFFAPFFHGALLYHWVSEDLLDDATADRGLRSPATRPEGSPAALPYGRLEHTWDLAWGAFGLSRVAPDRTVEQLTASPVEDVNGDGWIWADRELVHGPAVLALSVDSRRCSASRLTHDVADAFVRGRAIIRAAGDVPTAETVQALREQSDIILSNWEQAIAGYAIVELGRLAEMLTLLRDGSPEYRPHAHIRRFARSKGYVLALQFTVGSPWSNLETGPSSRLRTVLNLLGDLPDLDAAQAGDGLETIETARALLSEPYDFTDEDLHGGESCGL